MLFHSTSFLLVFLPAALLLYYAAGRFGSVRAARWTLLAISLGFYGMHEVRHLPLLLSSLSVNLAAVRAVERSRSRSVVAIGIAANVAVLAYFKAGASASPGLLFGSSAPLIPLAISFFTLEQIACLVDVRSGVAGRVQSLTYALFVCFFPHLVAGPIVRYRYLKDQLERTDLARFEAERLYEGLPLIAVGLAKKTILADPLAGFVNPVFGAAALSVPLCAGDARWAILAYALQLYLDFSGYCDIARGISALFGIKLPVNFETPYRATSLGDFWRRWHVTLHTFLRDYVFVPLAGRAGRSSARALLGVMFVFTLSGLWHGFGVTYLAWGAAHGVLLALGRSVGGARKPASVLAGALGWLSTFSTVAWLLVLFRSSSVEAAARLWSAAASFGGAASFLTTPLDGIRRALLVVVSSLIVFVVPVDAVRRRLEATDAQVRTLYPFAYGITLAVAVFFSFLGSSHEFIYFQF